MNFLENSPLIENLGWTLLHSLWQIAFLALGLFLGSRILIRRSANARYVAAVSTLVLSLLLPVFTFVWLSQNSLAERGTGKDFIENNLRKTTGKYPLVILLHQINNPFLINLKMENKTECN